MWIKLLSRPYLPAAIAGTLIISTVAAVIVSHRLQQLTAGIVGENVASLRAAEEMELAIREIRSRLYQFTLSRDFDFLDDLPRIDAEFEHWFSAAKTAATTPTEQQILSRVAPHFEVYQARFVKLRAANDVAAAEAAAEELAKHCSNQLLPLCHQYLEINEASIERNAETHRQLSGRLRWVLVLAGLIVPLSGVFLGYVVSRSISTELELSREQLRRSEQMAAVGRLASGMAHELRNPLTSILMMVQTSSDKDPPDLKIIEEEVQRMELTIQSCLDFARPRRPQRVVTDLRNVVAYVCRLIEGRIRRQHIELIIDLADDELQASVDPHQMHQVLLNLLMNAIESVGVGGRIGIVADADASSIQLTVWDEGIGIPYDLLPRVFEPFVTGKESGTGLGLSICEQIVKSHGGAIAASNRSEIGAEFHIQLPRQGGATNATIAGHRRRTQHSPLLPAGVS